jgi:hypothetical protein
MEMCISIVNGPTKMARKKFNAGYAWMIRNPERIIASADVSA